MSQLVRMSGMKLQPATGGGGSMAVSAVTTILCPICHKPNPWRERARFCQHCGHSIILNDDQPSDDRRYYITRIIKQGGQGAVYAGIDKHGQQYAIKEMLDRFLDPQERAEAVARFNAEADLLQRMAHPRIPRVYSHFTDEGRHYLTMDYIQGSDLDHIVAQRGVLPEAQVLEWVDQICDVLSYLHGRKLIYRDMKPSNVMIEPDGGVKLVDFGITKLFNPSERGTQIGTPGYAPPEQYQGLATPASDVYALGATLHYLLTGRDPTEYPPFSFPPARDIKPSVSRRTSEAIEKALRMQPEERWATIAEFRAQLRPLAAAPPAQVRVARPVQSQPSPARQQAPVAPVPQNSRTRQSVPQPVPAVAPSRARTRRRRSFRRVVRRMVFLLLVALIAGAVFLYLQAPELVRPYLPPLIEQVLPGGAAAPVQFVLADIASFAGNVCQNATKV